MSGAGSVGGGVFRNVVISGTGNVSGDIDCVSFTSSGVSNVSGSLKAEQVRISGTSRVDGKVDAGEVVVSGASEFGGGVHAKKFTVSGASTVRGNVNAEDVGLRGGLKVSGDCEAERFDAKGGFSIDGLLSAQSIEIRLYAQCTAREIGGGKVSVREDTSGWKRFVQDLGLLPERLLRAESIEADDVYLESTSAKVVRGGTVRLGPKCEIDLVEYTGEYVADPSAKVTASRKVEAS
jgi:cytoskeletal protein CcmA (bactofilin family)